MVFGDSDFATNFYLNLLGNKDLILSAIAVLAEDPALVAVRRKGMPSGTLLADLAHRGAEPHHLLGGGGARARRSACSSAARSACAACASSGGR